MKTGLVSAFAAGVILAACSGEPSEGEPTQPATETEAEAPPAETDEPSSTGTPASDPITRLCISQGDSGDVCDCATETLRASDTNVKTYAALARYFLDETNPAAPVEDRWRVTFDTVLEGQGGMAGRMDVSDPLSAAHRDAIQSCKG